MKKNTEHRIRAVEPGSIAEELNIEPGDVLLSVNDTNPQDVLDYHFLIHDEELTVCIRKPDGEEWEFEIEKEFDDDLGIQFENSFMDEYHSCRNKCIFCFIDQMPPGMRRSLYFKDDDSRLSFLQGNYVTLTNMKEEEIRRIIRCHLSPINISVHTTEPELRKKMLHNRFAGESLRYLDLLSEGGIEMNGQIVLCKDVNDGAHFTRTVEDLMCYIPCMQSVSVVPAGVTKYRKGLYPLKSFAKEDAGALIDEVERFQKEIYAQYGIHFIHASDEWYLMAGRPLPEEERYDGYLQLENGVGMMRLLIDEFARELARVREKITGKASPEEKKAAAAVPLREDNGSGAGRAEEKLTGRRTVSLATGTLAAPVIRKLGEDLKAVFPNLKINVCPIRNDFFGETITVSGLLTGRDIIRQLAGQELGETLLLPGNVLRSGEDVFLDDVTLSQVEEELGVPVTVTGSSGADLLHAFLGDRKDPDTCKKGNDSAEDGDAPDSANRERIPSDQDTDAGDPQTVYSRMYGNWDES